MSKEPQKIGMQAYDNVVNVPEAVNAVKKSFVLGFAWNLLFSLGSPLAGLTGGLVSSTASAIDSAVRPKLAEFFGDNSAGELLTRNFVVLSSTSLLMAAVTPLFGLSASFNILSALFIRAVYLVWAGESMGRHQLIPIRM